MDLLEYQGKQLFAKHGIAVPSGEVAATVEEARLLGLPGSAPGGAVVVVKDGPRPATVIVPGRTDVEVPVPAVGAVRDTTGAGDVFHGAFLVGLLQHWDLQTVATFSTAVSAIKCTQLSGRRGIPSFDQAIAFLRDHNIQVQA